MTTHPATAEALKEILREITMAQLKSLGILFTLFGAALAEGCRKPKGRAALTIGTFGFLLTVVGVVLAIVGALFE
ncbi:hypothetical protein FP568_13455 [Pandoraea pnomenusa]|uniref:hypothetical protein n=1 Tax=Pandoraea pnomenusa TaxID=93220 RepID=UPI00119841E6|nr:hypothetical protein [Pandoraea pnomenusa]QDX22163.1 hypothetical protein FP568_13455 [Pandoraea pnomenusa]